MIEHLIFFILMTIPLVILYAYDRKNIMKYLGVGILAISLDLIWDPIGMGFSLWYYTSQPQIFSVSVYMLLLYVHYLSFSYFLGNKANDWVIKKWK